MNEQSYLDPKWLEQREKKWLVESSMWFEDDTSNDYKATKHYFFYGDIEHYLENSEQHQFTTIVKYSPHFEINDLIHNVSRYWQWVLTDPERKGTSTHLTLNERFYSGISSVISSGNNFLEPKVIVALFHWVYGEKFEGPERHLALNDGVHNCSYAYDINIENLTHSLIDGIISYLWRKDNGDNVVIFKSLIPYFLSIYPHMPAMYFSTSLPKKRRFRGEDGKQYYRRSWIWNRWLQTTLNGYITSFETGHDISELTCNDDIALKQLTDGLVQLKMPDEYYQLQEFVHTYKGESLKMSK